jgi:hypothetical protein
VNDSTGTAPTPQGSPPATFPDYAHRAAVTPLAPGALPPAVGGTITVPLTRMVRVRRATGTVHLWHGLATLLTLGMWAPVWIAYGVATRERTLTVELDATGSIKATYN